MKPAVLTLMHSLLVGKYAVFIQFDTTKKMCSMYSNVYHASTGATGMAVVAKGMAKTFVTSCPMYSYWFKCFMLGVHKRIGQTT